MSLELTGWEASCWERCSKARVPEEDGAQLCRHSAPTLMKGLGEQDCSHTACSSSQGIFFWKRGIFPCLSKTPSARSQLGLHHLLCKCSWRLKPQQEEEKNPGQGTTVSSHSFLEKGLGLQRNAQNWLLNTDSSARSMLHSRVWHPQISAEPGNAGKAQPTGEREQRE